ncbi:MAG: hypothetical protein GX027_01725 [Clostridiaceae bacterium]|jgi:hypothetical protein|nr:hypothetical protein [Clostridiaceae bacterium]
MEDNRKPTGRVGGNNNVSAGNDQLGENEYEAFRNAKDIPDGAKRKKARR